MIIYRDEFNEMEDAVSAVFDYRAKHPQHKWAPYSVEWVQRDDTTVYVATIYDKEEA